MHEYLIRFADASEGATNLIMEDKQMNVGLILDGVDDDLGDKIIWRSSIKHIAGIKEKGRK
jgi:hypothetical protein